MHKIDEKYREIIGEPTPVQEMLSRLTEAQVTAFKVKEFYDPLNRHPKEEPFKLYRYEKNGRSESAIPYSTEYPGKPTRSARRGLARAERIQDLMAVGLKATRLARWRHTDSEIDDFLVEKISDGHLGFGF